jgi:LmbE family N-acetylglucosaminyl deacetylase
LKPDVVIGVASDHRHPDHTAAEILAHDACFVSGLKRGVGAPHRPRKFLRAVGLRGGRPSLIVDITSAMDAKRKAVRCYRSQFEPGGWGILEWVETGARYFGSLARVRFGEGFIQREPVIVDDLCGLAGTSF